MVSSLRSGGWQGSKQGTCVRWAAGDFSAWLSSAMMKSNGFTISSGSFRTRSSARKHAELMQSRTAVAAPETWAAPGFSHSPALTDRHDLGLYNMAAIVHALSVYCGWLCKAAVLGLRMTYLSGRLQQVHSRLQMSNRQLLRQQKTGLGTRTCGCSHEVMRIRLRCRRHWGVSFLSMSCRGMQDLGKRAPDKRMARRSSS
jgi:hypothetical protein